MTDEILTKTWACYQDAWAPITAAEREALLRKAVAEDLNFASLAGEGHGIAALIAHIEDFQKLFPGAYFRTHSLISHHNQFLAAWIQYNADGTEGVHGHSHVHYNQAGKLTTFAGFWKQ